MMLRMDLINRKVFSFKNTSYSGLGLEKVLKDFESFKPIINQFSPNNPIYCAYHMAYCMIQHTAVNPLQGHKLKYLAATSRQDNVKFMAKHSDIANQPTWIAVGTREDVPVKLNGTQICCLANHYQQKT
jgi:hypothetical protein